MPIKSKKQQRLMYAVANDKNIAKKVGMSQDVAREFIAATPKDKFKKLREQLKSKK
jgi:hypothetical protein